MSLSHQVTISPETPSEAVSKALKKANVKLAGTQVTTYVNEMKDSNVLSVSIPHIESSQLPTLVVQFSTQANATVYRSYEITGFMKSALLRKSIDEAFHVKVTTHFKNLNFNFEKLPLLEQNDVTALYKDLYNTLIKAKSTAKKLKKPLLVLIGEHHTENASLLCELIVLDVLKSIGLNNVFWEILDTISSIYEDDPNSLIIYKLNIMRKNQIDITPIESKLVHSYLQDIHDLFNMFENMGRPVPKELKTLIPLVDKVRDKAMVAKILTTIPLTPSKSTEQTRQEGEDPMVSLAKKFTEVLTQLLEKLEQALKERNTKNFQSSDIHMGIVGSDHLVISDDVDLKSSHYVFWISTWSKKLGLFADGQHVTIGKECNHLTHHMLSEMVTEAKKQHLEQIAVKVTSPLLALSTFSELKADATLKKDEESVALQSDANKTSSDKASTI